MSTAVDLGGESSQSETTVVTSQDVTLGVFTDNSYTNVAKTSESILPGTTTSVGIVVDNKAVVLQAQECWLSTIYDDEDEQAGRLTNLVLDGCAESGVVIVENFNSNQIRFELNSDQIFSTVSASELILQCNVYVCDPNTEGVCSSSTCPRFLLKYSQI